jgi:CubicO group peptidase (beta-lactamase class C family)
MYLGASEMPFFDMNRFSPFRLIALPAILIVLTGTSMARINTTAPGFLEGLDHYIMKGMADWGIPGFAVSIVKDGEIVYREGFGLRKLGEREKVDAQTVFGVASTTKAMTATALGMLVDEGLISWDDTVRDHLTWFGLSDPHVSEVVTIRDLLSHRTGIGRMTGNRLVFMPSRDRRRILEHVRHQPFEEPFRSGFVYSNMMYMVAGMIIEEVTGKTWDEFLPERLFQPLEMESATVSITQIRENDNAAWPHQEINGTVQAIPRRNFDNVGPAASVNASASDMARWMLFNLGQPGVYKGKTLVTTGIMNDIYQPQYVFQAADAIRDDFRAYSLGWYISSYEGYRVLHHGGATDGMNSLVVLVPELDLGIFAAGNLFCEFRTALAFHIIDLCLGIERDYDRSDRNLSRHKLNMESAWERRKSIENSRVQGTVPSLPLSEYTGVYHDRVYDQVEVRHTAGGGLEMQFWEDDEMVATLEHWHYDTFRASWKNPAMREKFVTFQLDSMGRVSQLNVTFTLRPVMIQVGLYPTDYYRVVEYKKDGQGRSAEN